MGSGVALLQQDGQPFFLLNCELDKLQPAKTGLGTGEGLIFGQYTDVIRAFTGNLRQMPSCGSGSQDVDEFELCRVARFRGISKGQSFLADVHEPADNFGIMAEDPELRFRG